MELYPRAYLCISCERRFYKEEAKFVYKRNCLCPECVESLEMYNKEAIHGAAPNMEYYVPAFVYSENFRNLFLKFKFSGDTAFGHLLAMVAAEHLKDNPYLKKFDFIIPVPISKKRLMERGFNQTDIMLKYIARAVDVPIMRCLRRKKHSTPQSNHRRFRSRTRNVRNSYECDMTFYGDRLILFDDIYTSGSTMYECAKLLLENGADEIIGIACAHSCDIYK